MNTSPDFIIIDDEALNNIVSKYQIIRVFENANIETFTDPEQGLIYLKEIISRPIKNKTILLLDINMPGKSGWELMNELELSIRIPRDLLLIYMLSSSIDPIDTEVTQNNPNIVDFIPKPLTVEIVQSI